jgi:exodeoxyribonuclease-3
LQALQAFVKAELMNHQQVIILGDFNIAPADIDVYDPIAWQGSVLVSEQERAAFARLIGLGFVDAFRAGSSSPGYSWWDYRGGQFVRDQGLRIDHILFSDALQLGFAECVVDRGPRGLERPSDHAPVVAEFDLSIDEE